MMKSGNGVGSRPVSIGTSLDADCSVCTSAEAETVSGVSSRSVGHEGPWEIGRPACFSGTGEASRTRKGFGSGFPISTIVIGGTPGKGMLTIASDGLVCARGVWTAAALPLHQRYILEHVVVHLLLVRHGRPPSTNRQSTHLSLGNIVLLY